MQVSANVDVDKQLIAKATHSGRIMVSLARSSRPTGQLLQSMKVPVVLIEARQLSRLQNSLAFPPPSSLQRLRSWRDGLCCLRRRHEALVDKAVMALV
jgi:hypothetical protein